MEDKISIRSIREGLENREFSAQEIARVFLSKISEREKDVHAFLTVTEELALSEAAALDAAIANKEPLPLLAAVPCAIKDCILVEGIACTAGSKMLESYVAPMDATVVARLKEKGALLVGKTNMDEFAMGASTENSAFGPTRNPHDTSRVPGGSSGGSAAAVGAKESLVSLGSDTGGSIRLPASFCGVVGLKPTYGAVSRSGLIALASSLDQIGPFASTIEDTERVFEAICGKDPLDATSVEYEYPSEREQSVKGMRIGIPKEYFAKGLDAEIQSRVSDTLSELEKQGALLQEITLPHTEYALSTYYIINTSEASANLARYDGLRFGSKGKEPQGNLLDWYLSVRGEGFGSEVKRRIMLGTYALSAGYYEAYYIKALKIRALLLRDFQQAFEQVDLIAGPVSPVLPFRIGERVKDPLAMYLVDVYTVPVNLAGLPALAVPVGTSSAGLPIGMQFIAPAFQEHVAFRAGKAVELLHGRNS
ncbi:MAG: Asp-tRNA(Asn)/Glu-tRNA(Gln) amidotransferase subunit GatA [Candidatus Yanofskybacteria bacterium]|nr:Asp-tRNA(Asn)/Glu-tRNA(Gln) amidotransferase subunit GatA [Candidatus Yanofskybacteria bacterium]